MANAGGLPASQEIVHRIAARVENDIILLSEIRMLSRYQEFLDGKSETDAQILDRLIDQWMVRTEADVSRFPHPSEAEIDRSLESLRKSFTSAEQYEARKKQSGLSDSEVRGIVASQLRSEEHTSELQSRSDLVCRLLLEKKKKKDNIDLDKQDADIASDANPSGSELDAVVLNSILFQTIPLVRHALVFFPAIETILVNAT